MSRPRISAALRERVAAKSRYRCGYCLTSRLVSGSTLQLDHLLPYSAGGATDETNLWLVCAECNVARSNRTTALDSTTGELHPLFNPRDDRWTDHFLWSEGGRIIVGTTPCGRVTVEALRLNRDRLVESRALWIEAGWHPPAD